MSQGRSVASVHREGFNTMGNTRSYGVLCSVKLQIDRLRSIVERRVRYDEGSYLAAAVSAMLLDREARR